jgi:hypothetical protein
MNEVIDEFFHPCFPFLWFIRSVAFMNRWYQLVFVDCQFFGCWLKFLIPQLWPVSNNEVKIRKIPLTHWKKQFFKKAFFRFRFAKPLKKWAKLILILTANADKTCIARSRQLKFTCKQVQTIKEGYGEQSYFCARDRKASKPNRTTSEIWELWIFSMRCVRFETRNWPQN